jgi:hypothetical protein
MAKFVVKKDNRGEWRWSFVANNGKTIAVSSEGYKNKNDCYHSIIIIEEQARAATVEEIRD